jgi:hypothetical protein
LAGQSYVCVCLPRPCCAAEAYRPGVEVRTILTGVSSRISMISLLPEEAAACASAVRDRDDAFGSRSPPNSDRPNMRPPARLPDAFSWRAVFAASVEEALLFFRIALEENNPLGERFASFTNIAFIMDVSFRAAGS